MILPPEERRTMADTFRHGKQARGKGVHAPRRRIPRLAIPHHLVYQEGRSDTPKPPQTTATRTLGQHALCLSGSVTVLWRALEPRMLARVARLSHLGCWGGREHGTAHAAEEGAHGRRVLYNCSSKRGMYQSVSDQHATNTASCTL